VNEAVLGRAIRRLSKCFQNASVQAEQPAVIATTYALLCRNSVFKRCSAVTAVSIEDTHSIGSVTKHDEVFA
jgi:hypothetical protein